MVSLFNTMAFCIKCDLVGFVRVVLETETFALMKKPHLISQFMRPAIEQRRLGIIQLLIEFADSKRLQVYEECESPLIFVYKRS